jgi:phosphoribosylamine--glycine ligase
VAILIATKKARSSRASILVFVMIFHAGTSRDAQNRVVTNGGRVLGVTALGKDARQAIDNAYSAVRKIRWGDNGHHYRTDIARRAIAR